MSVDSKMTAIADKIRGLLGLTGEMGLDAMATNLTTEQANITAALAALAEKGVTVPDGSNSNALAGLIAAIESGGGGNVAWGVVTPSSAVRYVEVTHDLGVIPDFVFYTILDVESVTNSIKAGVCIADAIKQAIGVSDSGMGLLQSGSNNTANVYRTSMGSLTSSDSGTTDSYGAPYAATENTVRLGDMATYSSYKLISGELYFWIAISGLV